MTPLGLGRSKEAFTLLHSEALSSMVWEFTLKRYRQGRTAVASVICREVFLAPG